MKRTTKILASTTGMFAAAAFSGLLAGASYAQASTAPGFHATAQASVAGTKARAMDGTAHDCKGANACKGQGGCKTGDNGCKGQNSCKGKGGCKTATTAPSFL